MHRSGLCLFALVLLLVTPRPCRADEPATAQALFDEASQLMKRGQYDLACAKLQESNRFDAGMGTQFHLADCWQHLGRSASAWALFRDVESEAHAAGQSARERVARDRAAALEPWLSRLIVAPRETVVAIGGNVPVANVSIVVRRDGVEMGREQWNAPIPVDPGTHVITLFAPTKLPWQTSIEVPPNGKVVKVDLPPLSDLQDDVLASGVGGAFTSPGRRSAGGVTAFMPASGEDVPRQNRGATQRTFGWILVGTSAVGLATGGYFGARSIEDHNESSAHCRNGSCDVVGSSLGDDSRREGNIAVGVLSGTAATLLLGTLLVVTAPSLPAARLDVGAMAGPGQSGLRISGVW